MIPLATIDHYASQVAHRPIAIVCDAPANEGGDYRFDGIIHLAPGICVSLQNVDRMKQSDPQPAYAILAVMHEAEHAATDSTDEGLVECTAFQNRWQLVRLFKLPAKLVRWILADEIVYHQSLPASYRTVC